MIASSEKRRQQSAEWSRQQTSNLKEVGDIPPVRNPQRKRRCRRDFGRFCLDYFPDTFVLPFSADHHRALSLIQSAVLDGTLAAIAMPRGSGKTTLCERAVLWAILYGHRRFIMLICADDPKAKKRLETLQIECETNDRLLDDFPRAIYPIRRLERIAHRARGQTYQGKSTYIVWGANDMVFPTIPRSASSGAVVQAGGLMGSVRGAKYTTPLGESIRPDLALFDDPQTRESASSLLQNQTREDIISADCLGMAGPGKAISALMACTVIKPGDMADRLLNRALHPDWHGYRSKLLYQFPDRMDLWNQYNDLRVAGLTADAGIGAATQFYLERQNDMDQGAAVAWPERRDSDDASALQHAMNLYFRSPEAFASEYQNEPHQGGEDDELLDIDGIMAKLNGCRRGEVPDVCTTLTAFIDVHKLLLYWCVIGWAPGATGYVVDYGTWPDQTVSYFSMATANQTIPMAFSSAGLEGSVYGACTTAFANLLGRKWQRDDGVAMEIDRLLIDANWGECRDVVYSAAQASPHSARITPSHGRGIGAKSIPLCDPGKRRQRGEVWGSEWQWKAGRSPIRHVVFDTNTWKSWAQIRLATPIGDRGSLSLFGKLRSGQELKPTTHRLFAEHVYSEYRTKVTGRGRTVDEWQLRPEASENHYLDALVGCCVAASLAGVSLDATATAHRQPQPKRYSNAREIRRQKKVKR